MTRKLQDVGAPRPRMGADRVGHLSSADPRPETGWRFLDSCERPVSGPFLPIGRHPETWVAAGRRDAERERWLDEFEGEL